MQKKSAILVSLITVTLLLTLVLLFSGCSTVKNNLKDGKSSKQVKQESALKNEENWEDGVPKEEQALYTYTENVSGFKVFSTRQQGGCGKRGNILY